jgi:heme a synthase
MAELSKEDTPMNLRAGGQRAAEKNRAIVIWLIVCCGMVVAMMLIGAITRLTESGLSMVEWRPLIGAFPPISDAEWRRVFDLYRKTSEYRLENAGMSLAEFKTIFWWEFIHRLWGRLIGAAFGLPMIWFALRGYLTKPLALRLFVLFLLGAAQGAIGWWMVKSGLVDRADVSQYRLTVHLGIAFLILGAMLWVVLDLVNCSTAPPISPPVSPSLRRYAAGLLLLISVTALSGGLVAGLNAGYAYNDWPYMNGQIVPEEYGDLTPAWINLFDNVAAVQFDHRLLAYASVLGAILLWIAAWRNGLRRTARRPFDLLVMMALVQVALGVSTLLLVVPTPLAVAHQGGAITLFCLAVWAAHTVYRNLAAPAQSS